jgi:hypothetical protein
VRIVVHPKDPTLEWMEVLVPDHWAAALESETDRILTLTTENGADALQLSLTSQRYQPGMGLPDLMEWLSVWHRVRGGMLLGAPPGVVRPRGTKTHRQTIGECDRLMMLWHVRPQP